MDLMLFYVSKQTLLLNFLFFFFFCFLKYYFSILAIMLEWMVPTFMLGLFWGNNSIKKEVHGNQTWTTKVLIRRNMLSERMSGPRSLFCLTSASSPCTKVMTQSYAVPRLPSTAGLLINLKHPDHRVVMLKPINGKETYFERFLCKKHSFADQWVFLVCGTSLSEPQEFFPVFCSRSSSLSAPASLLWAPSFPAGRWELACLFPLVLSLWELS